MGQPKKEPFRFLSQEEFFELDLDSRVEYLKRAQEELAARQLKLRGRPEETDTEKDSESS